MLMLAERASLIGCTMSQRASGGGSAGCSPVRNVHYGVVVTRLEGDFEAVDELLAVERSGELRGIGRIELSRSGRIGPLVELSAARRSHPEGYRDVHADAPFSARLEAVMRSGSPIGMGKGDRYGVFPLERLGQSGDKTDDWILWAARADQAAQLAGFPKTTAALLIGAFGELQDNVFRHSEAPTTGVVAYAVTAEGFEFVASDLGLGVLASLKTHPDYSELEDSGQALRTAVADGESRFGRDSGSGLGLSQLFRALASQDGDLRFRSGDHVLEIRGHSPSLKGTLEVRHKAELVGLTVSVLCRPFGR